MLAIGTRASYEKNGGTPDSAGGGRAGCAVPPSSCHLPVRKVPGWRAFGFPLGLWAAPRRIPGAGAGAEEAGEGGTPPWWPDVYGLPRLALYCLPGLAPGGSLAIDSNDGGEFYYGCAREAILPSRR